MTEGSSISDLDFNGLLAREWLCTNGLGGFASSTSCALNTRRYHGLLIAAMAPPVRRMVLLSRVEETIRCDGGEHELACNEYPGTIWPRGHELLRAFSTDPHPRWAYQANGWTLQKELRLLQGENTVVLTYTLLGGGRAVDLEIRPLLALRGMHELSYQWNGKLQASARGKESWHVPATRRTPEIFFSHNGHFDPRAHWYLNHIYRRDLEHGYAGLEDLWSPGATHCRLLPGQPMHFACSTDPLDLQAAVEKAGRQATESSARRAATRSMVVVPGKSGQPDQSDRDFEVLVEASCDHLLTMSASESLGFAGQYHWSPPSVRSAVAGFTGLFLVPGRFTLARSFLGVLAGQLNRGLLPTDYPSDGSEPTSRGADVSLWYIHAIRQYLLYSGDELAVSQQFLPAALGIVDAYQQGTDHGIGMDEAGLLRCGDEHTAATWMNTQVGEFPVNARHGRPVEINSLWYNALRSTADLCRRLDRPADADRLDALAARTKVAFNEQFWNEAEECCFDVVGDGANDAAIRPNQLLAASLPFAVLDESRWPAVVERVRHELAVPTGVRTLSPRDPRYLGRYGGQLLHRDQAAHNGSAYPWLLGPLVTALVRLDPQNAAARASAREFLTPCLQQLRGEGLGHLFELCDGDSPHAPGGAIASPLSVAEILRCYAEDILQRAPKMLAAAPAASNAE